MNQDGRQCHVSNYYYLGLQRGQPEKFTFSRRNVVRFLNDCLCWNTEIFISSYSPGRPLLSTIIITIISGINRGIMSGEAFPNTPEYQGSATRETLFGTLGRSWVFLHYILIMANHLVVNSINIWISDNNFPFLIWFWFVILTVLLVNSRNL